MSNSTTIQAPESGIQILENLYVTSSPTDSSILQHDGTIICWDQFMNELEFE